MNLQEKRKPFAPLHPNRSHFVASIILNVEPPSPLPSTSFLPLASPLTPPSPLHPSSSPGSVPPSTVTSTPRNLTRATVNASSPMPSSNTNASESSVPSLSSVSTQNSSTISSTSEPSPGSPPPQTSIIKTSTTTSGTPPDLYKATSQSHFTTYPAIHTTSTPDAPVNPAVPNPNGSSKHSSPHIGAIVGGVLGGLVFVFLVGVCVRVSRRRYRGSSERWMETALVPASPHTAHYSTDSVEWNARLDNTMHQNELERSRVQVDGSEDDMDFRCAESVSTLSAEYPEAETETQAQRRRAEILSQIRAALVSVRT